jgi:hypothetical protein
VSSGTTRTTYTAATAVYRSQRWSRGGRHETTRDAAGGSLDGRSGACRSWGASRRPGTRARTVRVGVSGVRPSGRGVTVAIRRDGLPRPSPSRYATCVATVGTVRGPVTAGSVDRPCGEVVFEVDPRVVRGTRSIRPSGGRRSDPPGVRPESHTPLGVLRRPASPPVTRSVGRGVRRSLLTRVRFRRKLGSEVGSPSVRRRCGSDGTPSTGGKRPPSWYCARWTVVIASVSRVVTRGPGDTTPRLGTHRARPLRPRTPFRRRRPYESAVSGIVHHTYRPVNVPADDQDDSIVRNCPHRTRPCDRVSGDVRRPRQQSPPKRS